MFYLQQPFTVHQVEHQCLVHLFVSSAGGKRTWTFTGSQIDILWQPLGQWFNARIGSLCCWFRTRHHMVENCRFSEEKKANKIKHFIKLSCFEKCSKFHSNANGHILICLPSFLCLLSIQEIKSTEGIPNRHTYTAWPRTTSRFLLCKLNNYKWIIINWIIKGQQIKLWYVLFNKKPEYKRVRCTWYWWGWGMGGGGHKNIYSTCI